MSRVAELQDLLEPTQIVADIVSKYENWQTQRDNKVEEWKEQRNYIFATDTTTTSNSSLPWKNSTHTPKLAQIRDNLHANYMAALFSNSDWLKWEGANRDANTIAKRETIEGYMKNKVDSSDFEVVIEKLLYDYIDYGNAFAEVIFVNESTKNEETGEITRGYVGPKLARVSPLDLVFDATSVSFERAPKIVRYVKSVGELNKEITERPDLGYAQDTVEQINHIRQSIAEFRDSDIDKAEGFIADGFGTLKEYYSSGMVEVLEFEGDIYDSTNDKFYKNYKITVVDRRFVARAVQSDSWLGTGTKVHVGWRDRQDNLYAMGPLENLVGLQYRIDHLENLKADGMDLTIHPPKVLKGSVEPFVWEPDAEIIIPDADGSVEMLAPNAAVFQVNNEIAYLMNLMDEMAGSPREAMGIRTPGEKTAFEVASLQNAAGRIFDAKVHKFEKVLMLKALNIMLEMARRNLEGTELIRVLQDDLSSVSFLEVTKEDILAEGKLRPVGAKHFAAQAQLMQNMNGVFGGPVGQIIAPHISGKELARVVEEVFSWEKYSVIKENIAVMEQAETQQLLNAADEQTEVIAATPIAGGPSGSEMV